MGRQAEGSELDIEEYVNAAADFRAGVVGEDRLYLDVRRARRALSVALLVDVSASTDSWVSGQQRIIDVEKDALLVVCEALAALGDQHAIFAFAGESAEHVSIVPLKRFTEHAGDPCAPEDRCARTGRLHANRSGDSSHHRRPRAASSPTAACCWFCPTESRTTSMRMKGRTASRTHDRPSLKRGCRMSTCSA